MLCAAALMCHAPIVIPGIAGARARDCRRTTAAMREAAVHIQRQAPERLVVVSPHAPRHQDGFGFQAGPRVEGDLAAFGHPEAEVAFHSDPEACDTLLKESGDRIHPFHAATLDHGSLVPLWFLQEAGLDVPVVVVSLPRRSGHEQAFGAQLRASLDRLGAPWALVASGDMSHALAPGAPGGFHPTAHRFDDSLVNLIQAGRLADLWQLDSDLRALAKEDVVESLRVAEGARPEGPSRVLAYEAPFGVGYLEAVLQ